MSETAAAVKEIFSQMSANLNPDAAKGMNSVIQFNLSGDGGGNYNVVIKDGTATVNEGTHASPNMTMTMAAQDYVDMITGKLNGQMAFMSGKLKISGDMGLAMKMQTLFKRPKRHHTRDEAGWAQAYPAFCVSGGAESSVRASTLAMPRSRLPNTSPPRIPPTAPATSP